jgi:hypothetical protein
VDNNYNRKSVNFSALPTLFCLGGVLIIASIDFAIRYATLPRFQKRINKMLQKEIKDK